MSAAFYLGWIIAVILVAVGIYAMLAPHSLAVRYGVSAHGQGAAGWVRATGVRDVALGVALGATAYLHALTLLVVLAAMGVIVSIADFRIVSHHGEAQRHRAAHAIHASGIVAFVLIIAMALFAIGR
jgi:hypothetical protein